MNEFKRNEKGVIESLKCEYNEDGSLNWRAMIPKEFIKVNRQAFPEGQVPDSIDGLPDNKLLILLGGIKWAAAARGLTSRKTKVDYVTDGHAVCTVDVSFIPNFENPEGLHYSDCGAATIQTTNGFGRLFLETIAANRAFVRAVRNALGINIVGQDEIAPQDKNGVVPQPEPESESQNIVGSQAQDSLRDRMTKYFTKKAVKDIAFEAFKERDITFQEFKDYVISKAIPRIDAEKWGDDWKSVPGEECFLLMNKIQSK